MNSKLTIENIFDLLAPLTKIGNVSTVGTGFEGWICIRPSDSEDGFNNSTIDVIYREDYFQLQQGDDMTHEIYDHECILKLIYKNIIISDFNAGRLNKFEKACGVTIDLLKTSVMMFKWATESTEMPIHFNRNVYAWSVYHGCINNGSGFTQDVVAKCKARSCNICQATRNITTLDHSGQRITTSPIYHSGNREPMLFNNNAVHCHYVVWSNNHDCNEFSIDKSLHVNANNIFTHSTVVYNHKHYHVIYGRYFDIRMYELCYTILSSINLRTLLDISEFFHPFGNFYLNCSPEARRHFRIAIMCLVHCFNVLLLKYDIVDKPKHIKAKYILELYDQSMPKRFNPILEKYNDFFVSLGIYNF